MLQNQSRFFNASQEKLNDIIKPKKDLIYESMKKLFESGKVITRFVNKCSAFVDQIQYQDQENTKIGKPLIAKNLLYFKSALKFYMGYMNLDDDKIKKKRFNH